MPASGKTQFAVMAFLALAWPSAGAVPGPENDYGRGSIGGMKGAIEWEPLLQGTGLDGWTESGPPWSPGGWSRDGDTVVGNLSGRKKSRITRGDTTWTDYELSVFATLVEKGSSCLQVHLRVSADGRSFYMVEMNLGWQTLNVSRRGPDTEGVEKLSAVNFAFEPGREYHLVVAARGKSLTTYVDGVLVNQLTDDFCDRGGVGLNMWWTTAARFRDPRIRHYH